MNRSLMAGMLPCLAALLSACATTVKVPEIPMFDQPDFTAA